MKQKDTTQKNPTMKRSFLMIKQLQENLKMRNFQELFKNTAIYRMFFSSTGITGNTGPVGALLHKRLGTYLGQTALKML
jgi:hypothetical protein